MGLGEVAALEGVLVTRNVLDSGRVTQQQAGGRTLALKVLTQKTTTFNSGGASCVGRRMRVQQTTTVEGMAPLVEVFNDTAYACVKAGSADTLKGGWQWADGSKRKAFYGQSATGTAQKRAYVR